VLLVVDFVDNYTLQPKNEIQSQYYHLEKVNIMVHITYRHGLDSNEENKVILKEYHFYIRNDQFHDLAYIQHCFHFFTISLRRRTYRWIKIGFGQIVADASSKNACVFQWLCVFHKKFKVSHIWNYFESRNGKWEHDGEGACIKESYIGNK
jgi:phage terminase large subunit-like protein